MKKLLFGLIASAVIVCAAQPALAGGHGHHGGHGYHGGHGHGGPNFRVGFYSGYGPGGYWPGYYAPRPYYPYPYAYPYPVAPVPVVAPVAPVYPVYPAPYGAAFSYSSPGFSFSVAR